MFHPDSGYAIQSAVGPVFDLTKWTGRGRIAMSVAVFVFGALFLAAAAYAWEPSWFHRRTPQELKELVDGLRDAARDYPWAMRGGVAVAALLGVLCLLGASTLLTDAFRRDFYFRAGPGGLSIRMPNGFSWRHLGLISRALELDLPWEEIKKYEITQVKKLGAMSRNAGNVRADIEIITRAGKRHVLGLDGLEAPAYLIHERIDEARRAPQESALWSLPEEQAV